ncbi:hypothetical protein [Aliiruegeria lutimaris]|uniref:hypothetical protein n=1 Tax=Aliiruegeria lutimaris TaxID=571298 RepID=UPI001113B79D|nr:hypothetical protein [Aliiruegeria lutimaris]
MDRLDDFGTNSLKWILDKTGSTSELKKSLEDRANRLASSEIDCPVGVTLSELIKEVSTGISEADFATSEYDGRSTEVNARALSEMLPDPTLRRRSDLCLVWDDDLGYTGFETGARGWFLQCKNPKTFCERFDDAKDVILTGTGLAGGALGAAAIGSSSLGTTAVLHSSGGLILTGSGGYIAGTLGTVGATGIAVATSPVTLGALVVPV